MKCEVKMDGYWPSSFCVFIDRDGVKFVNLQKREQDQCSAILNNKLGQQRIFAAAASEPEANERGSSLISRRLHYRDLQSLFLTKRKELWLCANGRFRMRSGMRKELWLCANRNILVCAV